MQVYKSIYVEDKAFNVIQIKYKDYIIPSHYVLSSQHQIVGEILKSFTEIIAVGYEISSHLPQIYINQVPKAINQKEEEIKENTRKNKIPKNNEEIPNVPTSNLQEKYLYKLDESSNEDEEMKEPNIAEDKKPSESKEDIKTESMNKIFQKSKFADSKKPNYKTNSKKESMNNRDQTLQLPDKLKDKQQIIKESNNKEKNEIIKIKGKRASKRTNKRRKPKRESKKKAKAKEDNDTILDVNKESISDSINNERSNNESINDNLEEQQNTLKIMKPSKSESVKSKTKEGASKNEENINIEDPKDNNNSKEGNSKGRNKRKKINESENDDSNEINQEVVKLTRKIGRAHV